MPARKYKTDPVQLLAEGQQIIHTTSDAKYRHKVEMVNAQILEDTLDAHFAIYRQPNDKLASLCAFKCNN